MNVCSSHRQGMLNRCMRRASRVYSGAHAPATLYPNSLVRGILLLLLSWRQTFHYSLRLPNIKEIPRQSLVQVSLDWPWNISDGEMERCLCFGSGWTLGRAQDSEIWMLSRGALERDEAGYLRLRDRSDVGRGFWRRRHVDPWPSSIRETLRRRVSRTLRVG